MSLYDIKKSLEILGLFEKSTNAMKLVSLSLHHQLKKIIPEFKEKFNANTAIIENYFNVTVIDGQRAFIFISSDRGFCGDYVNNMFHQFEKIYAEYQETVFYIIIGKMLIHKIESNKYKTNKIISIISFKMDKFAAIYEQIVTICKEQNITFLSAFYTEALSISNRLIYEYSFHADYKNYAIKKNFSTGHFDSEPMIVLFFNYFFISFIFHIFYQSLFAEQGARFIAMDAALTNTHEAIDKNKKLYFKVRQQKINNQLQDLVSSLL